MSEPTASMTEVSKVFDGDTGVRAVDLAVPPGVILGLIGPSGCGKTTLLRLLTGLHAPTAGTVEVFGTDPRHFDRAQRQRVGYMPQIPVLFPNLSLRANLSFVAALYGVRGRRRRAHLSELLAFTGLQDDGATLFAQASGGMQRRLSLAATLVHDPDLLLLDEPTAGVDPLLRARFWERFRSLRDAGRTIVVSTQYVGEAAECDLVGVLVDGALVVVDTPEGLVEATAVPTVPDDRTAGADFDEVFARIVHRARRRADQVAVA
jgi:ABC-2 type transport system ATP-binding protein